MTRRKLLIRDLTLRDGQQSLFATRMTQEQVDRVLPYYKDAKFYAMEVWGGAVPDSIMRYLQENPWTRLEKIRQAVGEVSKLTAHAAVTFLVTTLIPMKSLKASTAMQCVPASGS